MDKFGGDTGEQLELDGVQSGAGTTTRSIVGSCNRECLPVQGESERWIREPDR